MAFSIGKRIGSFRHAFRGIATILRTQHNTWIHFAATILVVALGYYLSLAVLEWVAVVLAIGGVWVAEALNTSVEFLADEVSKDHRELIGKGQKM